MEDRAQCYTEREEAHLLLTDNLTNKGETYGIKLVDESYISERFTNIALSPSAREKLLNSMINILVLPDSPEKDQDPTSQFADTILVVSAKPYAWSLFILPKIPSISSLMKNTPRKVKNPEELRELHDNLNGMKADVLAGIENRMAAVFTAKDTTWTPA
eukprot:1892921-Ditylum_brightwellii.AAC.1